MPLPSRPYPNSKSWKVKVDPYQTVRVDRNRYSVPRRYVGRWIHAQIGCSRITLWAEDRKVAEHPGKSFCGRSTSPSTTDASAGLRSSNC